MAKIKPQIDNKKNKIMSNDKDIEELLELPIGETKHHAHLKENVCKRKLCTTKS